MEVESRTKDEPEVTRRKLIKRGAVGVLGATAAAAALTALTPGSASAADVGDPLLLGEENLSPGRTRITVRDSYDTLDIFGGDDGSILHIERGFGGAAPLSVRNLDGTAFLASGENRGIIAGGYHVFGVQGLSGTGIGVLGQSNVGTGVKAEILEAEGLAFEAVGPVKFSTSDIATVPSSTDRVTVTPGLRLSDTSKVLAVLQGNPGNHAAVEHVEIAPAPGGGTFTIVLTKAPARAVSVAWFVME